MKKIFKNKKSMLFSLIASSLAVGSMLVISASLTSCSQSEEKPQIEQLIVQEDGYYLNNMNPNIQDLKVYSYTDPNTNTKTFRFINVTDNLSANFGFSGWTVFGSNVEKTGLISTFNNKNLYIPESIIVQDVICNIVNVTAFTSNNALEYVYCSKEIQTIGTSAFSSCTNLVNFNLPDTNNLININDFAFNYCNKLNAFDFGKTKLSIIGESAFSNCSNLRSKIVIPSTITLIRKNAFDHVPVSSIEVQENNYYVLASKESVGNAQIVIKKEATNPTNTFDYSALPVVETGLVCGELTIDPNATEIVDGLFLNKIGLVGKLFISENISLIGFDAFSGCNITSVEVASGNTTYALASKATVGDAQIVVEKMDVEFDYSSSIVAGGLAFGNLTIPETTSDIAQDMFVGCSGLNGVINFPSSLITIGNNAFSDCGKLEGITFKEDSLLETIGKSAFMGCGNLSGIIKLPKFVTILGSSAFRFCHSIVGIDFSALVSDIKIGADCFNGCTSITGELIISNNIITIGNNAFMDTNFTEVNFLQESPLSILAVTELFAKHTGSNDEIIIYVPASGLSSWQNTPDIDKILGIANINQIRSK